MNYAELHLHTPYSFLDGGSHIEALVRRAAELGMPALAMTDHDNTAGAVKFVNLCRDYGIKPILGAELTMEDGSHLTLLARDQRGYACVCRLISMGYSNGGRLTPCLPWSRLTIDNCICLSGCRRSKIASLVREHRHDEAMEWAIRLRDLFGWESFYIELQDDRTPHCTRVNRELSLLADRIGVGVVATNNVHYATKDDFIAHDMLRCVATKTKREEPHPDKPLNAERYLKSAREMTGMFAWRPDAVANTIRVAEQCEVALPMPGDVTPRYPVPEGKGDADAYLRHLTYKGGAARYGKFTEKILRRVEHELSVITKLGYADFFLMCWEIVRWARKQGIRTTGRGSAADSCVAYCLTLTDVDVIRRNLPFARFLTEGKKPDIDMDFPSERRDDVFRYIVQKYGEAHVGMVCTFHTYWAKGAVRDIGKALSIPPDALEWLSDNLSGFIDADRIEEAFTRYAELRPHAAIKDRFKLLFQCASKIAGFPRHIGTHSSGIVISRLPLADIAPLQPSARGITQIWELDKDDAESIGAIKFDVLSLRMLSAVVDAERNIRQGDSLDRINRIDRIHESVVMDESGQYSNTPSLHYSSNNPANPVNPVKKNRFSYDSIPFNDPDTFRMIRAGKAVGTFQFESAAQMALAATLNPEHFEDLVAAVALIRPGPIQGHVVQRFVACRNGWMRADIIHPALAITLNKTYGCIVFQEQVNDVVAIMTGCSDAEADRFRKSITQHTKMGTMQKLREEFVRRSCAHRRDFDEERANRLFDQIQGWAGYGFTEGHAASFALLGYRSAYMSVHHPAELFAGLMNHQPMGFFNSNTLAGEARRRGVPVLPVDINASGDKCVAEAEEDILDFRISNFEGWSSRKAAAEMRLLLDRTSQPPQLSPSSLESCDASDHVTAEGFGAPLLSDYKSAISKPPYFHTAIRLGLRLVADLSEEDIAAIEAAREERPFESLLDFCIRVPLHRNKVENLILCGAFDSLHEHRRGLIWRLDETLGVANSYRGSSDQSSVISDQSEVGSRQPVDYRGRECHYSPLTTHHSQSDSQLSTLNSQPYLHLGSARGLATPINWDIEDFSPWDKFLWTWRITGVCAECHVFAYLREELKRNGIMTAYEAMLQKHGKRVKVAGLNIRPHRPHTVSGNPVLFSIVEDETEMLQVSVLGDAIWETTTVFLTSPAVLVEGTIERRGKGSSLMLEKAQPLRMQDFARQGPTLIASPPATRTYTGTKTRSSAELEATPH